MNKIKTLFCFLAVLTLFSCTNTTKDDPKLVYETVTDIDGNIYHAVTIGTQTWLVENLKTTKYRNGDLIGNTSPATKDISSESTPKYQWAYNGNEANVAKYGRLYTWYAVADSRNIAPTGWHVATDAEWSTLENYISVNTGTSISVGKALADTSTWLAYPTEGRIGNNLLVNNRSGFSAVANGVRYNSSFDLFGNSGAIWCSTENDANNAWYRCFHYDQNNIDRKYFTKSYGLSVRCIKDVYVNSKLPTISTKYITGITSTTAISGGNISNDGGSPIISQGVCWSTTINPTTNNFKSINASITNDFISTIGAILPNTTYYVRAYATNNTGTSYGNMVCFSTTSTVSDIDGNIYNTVTIGTQTWMVENLRTSKYRDGSTISNITSTTIWAGLTTGAWCNFNNDVTNNNKYGKIYNWYAVSDSRNIAPIGWHVPSNTEWTTLRYYVRSAKALAATTEWTTTSTINTIGCDLSLNNSSGFNALPSGYRYTDGTFYYIGNSSYWWSSDLFGSNAQGSGMNYNDVRLNDYNFTKSTGCSIRCVMDSK